MASKKFLNPINLVNLASDPSSPVEGEIYYNTTSDAVKVYANGAWVAIGSGGGVTVSATAPASPTTGSAWYKNDTGEFYIYDGTYWVEVNGVVQPPTAIDSLTDVTITSVADNEVLAYDTTSSLWINQTAAEAGLATLTGTETLSNKTLTTPTINGPAITAVGQTPTIHGIYLPAPHNIIFEGTTANEFETTFEAGEPTADRTITLPDATGTIQLRVADVSDTEISYLNGVTSAIQTQIDGKISASSSDTLTNKTLTTPKINENVTLTATSTELNVLDGITASTAELNIMDGVTSTATELNILDGATLTTTELNYVDGVTSAIQTQIDNKASLSGATFTGEIEATKLKAATVGGDEGGEIFLGPALTNTTLAGGVTIDVYQNRLRIFEQGGTARGVYIDLSNAAAGVATNLVSGGGSSTLDGLTDVTITGTPADNNVLAYDTSTSQWINQTAPAAGLLDTSATSQTKAGDLTITGNLTVNGTTTTINSTAINVNNQVIFEGSTADNFETTLTAINPTADNTISLPNASGTIALTSNLSSYAPLASPVLTGVPETPDAVAGSSSGVIANTRYVDTAIGVVTSGLAANYQPKDDDLTQIAGLTQNGFLKKEAAGWFIDGSTFASTTSPTFTGNVVLPVETSIGDVSSVEIGYLNNVSSSIQTQLDSKANLLAGKIEDSIIPDTIARVDDVENSLGDYIPVEDKGVADGVASLNSIGQVPAEQLNLTAYSLIASPTFTGNVGLPSTTTIGTVTGTEIGYLDGVTSAIQTQIDNKLSTSLAVSDYLSKADATSNYQPKDGDLTAIAALAGTSGFLKKAGADTWTLDTNAYLTTDSAASTYLTINNATSSYATLAAPTFTGIVVLPSTTSIGTVTSTEIGYLDGVTSAIQTQLNAKEASHSHPYQTANASLSSIAALAGTAGFIKFDGTSTYTVDTNTYLVRNQPTIDTAIIAGTTTFSIANSIATTLNIGGAATAITIGSNNANAETIIRTPKINSDASSVQLFNVTSTTVEFAGAATTLHVGGTSTANSTFNVGANATASGNLKTLNIATGGASGSSTTINVGTVNDGTTNLYGDVVAHGTIEVPTPTINAQAANKGYVDALAAGINIKQQAKYATTSALGVTYTAGTSDTSGGLGEGAYITATANGAFSPDGTEVVAGERVLVKNQADAKQNGIYVVTDPGDGDSPFILTRAADFNGESATNGNIKNGDYVFITAGSVNSNASFVVSQVGTSTSPTGGIKLGTDNVVFSQYSGVPGNITTLGVVTQGVWQSTRIEKEYLDTELATLANPTFTGNVVVPTPVVDTHAATKKYVDDSILANAASLPDIIPLDDIRGQFNGIDSRFQPKFQGETLSILNPLRLLLSVNGIIQSVDFPEYVWQSFLPREGFMVDNDGYIAFSEVPPAGSTFDARLMPGPNINSVKKGYPFRAVDILLGV